MKKTFNRLLAATVAIPVALGQVLAITATAADKVPLSVTAEKLLKVDAETGFPEKVESDSFTFTQISTWNETVADILAQAEDKTIELNAKEIVGSLNSVNYYVSLLKEIVNASPDPTATLKDGVITISGTADLAAYLAPELNDKFAALGYENVTIDTSILEGVVYTATITTDLANSKEVSADLKFTAGGKEYTVSTAADYMDAVYADLSAQVQAAVDQKVKDLAAEYGMTEEEVRANAEFDIDGDLAALKEVTDKLANKIKVFNSKYELFQDANISERTYSTADEALAAALKYAEKQGIAAAANQPTTVNGMVAKYGATFDEAVASFNTSLKNADVNVTIDVSSSEIATLLNGASNVVVSAANGAYSADFAIADAEADQVKAYVEAEVAKAGLDKEVESVETVKTVSIDANAAGTVSFDVVRTVTVELKDKETTSSSTEESGSSDTTIASGEGSDVGTETTASGEGSDVGTETTASGEGSDVGTETTASGEGSDVGTETTASGEGSDVGTETTASGEGSDVGTETTASGEGSDVGTETTATEGTGDTTGTTETLPTNVSEVKVNLIDVEESNGIYFSHEESFDVADLIDSVTLVLDNGETMDVDPETAIAFKTTPSEVYETVDQSAGKGKVYYRGEVEIYYTAQPDLEIAEKPTVLVAKKGDTDLNGEIDTFDTYELLLYHAMEGSGWDPSFKTIGTDDASLVKLVYYITDIDTESKLGKRGEDDKNGVIDTFDAYYQLLYISMIGSGYTDGTWDDVLKHTAK